MNLGNDEEPRYFPMEVCEVLRGQAARVDLDSSQRKAMSKFAIRPAYRNAASIANESQTMLKLNHQTSILSDWLVALGARLNKVEGRVLSAPKLQYKESSANPKFGSWNLSQAAFVNPVTGFGYAVLRLSPQNKKPTDDSKFRICLEVFKSEMNNLGLKPAQLAFIQEIFLQLQVGTKQYNVDQFRNDLRQFFKGTEEGKMFSENPSKKKILLVIGPEDTRIFNRLKHDLERVIGIRSVYVVNSRFLQKDGDRQLMANLLMKWNLQLGGTNWKLMQKYGGLWGDGKTLFVGYDITHPSPSSREGAPSVAAYVANPSGDMAQFPAIYKCQYKEDSKKVTGKRQAEEPAKHLQGVMVDFIKKWFVDHNRTLPENIVVYRDGVSDGQFEMVRDDEAGKIRAAIEEARENVSLGDKKPVSEVPNVALTVAIVGKRHNVSLQFTNLVFIHDGLG